MKDLVGAVLLAAALPAQAADVLNVLWIDIDDQSPWYSSYGDSTIETPNIDALARAGVLFERAYVPTPVCSPTRSALITGSYPIRLGTHDHRSGRVPENPIRLPEGVRTLPELFRAAGYETYNASKDDFNFSYVRADLYTIAGEERPSVAAAKAQAMASSAKVPAVATELRKSALERGDQSWKGPAGGGDWRDVPAGRPFFGQMSIPGGKGTRYLAAELERYGITPVKPEDVRVPKQYPDIPQVRAHIATHYNAILRTDYQLGRVVARLEQDGLWRRTVIFFFSDHGSDLPRSKEFCYEEGLHVPLIVVAPGLPGLVAPGTRRKDLVSLMDITATSLAVAGIPIPSTMDSKDLFAADYRRGYVFSSADRMSNVIDRVRAVTGPRFRYIRNFMTDRPLMNWGHREMIALGAPERSSFLTVRRLAEAGELTPAQAAPYGPRVAEELYDLEADPDEVVNLASDSRHREQLSRMRAALDGWLEDTDDKGRHPRSPAAMSEIIERYPRNWLRSPEFAHLPSN